MSFFFSSRRRHTRCSRDWSSDVCSSDLPAQVAPVTIRAYRPSSPQRTLGMNESADAVAGFELNRARLFGLAYRMLGSRAEAEDVVPSTCTPRTRAHASFNRLAISFRVPAGTYQPQPVHA